MAHMGISDAVRQRFLDPTVFSSKPGLIPERTAFFAVFSDYTATLKSQHGKWFFLYNSVLVLIRKTTCSCGVKLPFKKKMGSFNNKLNLSDRHEYEKNQPLPTLHLAFLSFWF